MYCRNYNRNRGGDVKRNVSKGDVPVLIMAVLAEAPSHGYAIAREIERRSGAQLGVKEGTLYPALRVLEQSGLIEGKWQTPESGPARKVYVLTVAGHGELERRARSWNDYARAVGRALGGDDAQHA